MDTESLENITFRKRQTSVSLDSIVDLSVSTDENDITILDTTLMSLPDNLHNNENELVNNLNEEIKILKMQLMNAQQEIENLNAENYRLKSDLKNVQTCKNICLSPEKKIKTPSSTRKKKQESPIRLDIESKRSDSNKTKSSCNNKGTQTTYLNMEAQTQTKSVTSLPLRCVSNKTSTQHLEKEQKIFKNKICLISANKTNKILTIAKDTFLNTEICHYITPQCGILQLISDLKNKIVSFTKLDYCVILIGEEDFRKTNNYIEIVFEIRKTLQEIQNTNIILCAPTFKCNDFSEMFNWRIETFNYLLYLDIDTHKYAALLDSNLKLSYDYSMFSQYTGRLNDVGMKNIMNNILLLMNTKKCTSDLTKKTGILPTPDVSPNTDFFLF